MKDPTASRAIYWLDSHKDQTRTNRDAARDILRKRDDGMKAQAEKLAQAFAKL